MLCISGWTVNIAWVTCINILCTFITIVTLLDLCLCDVVHLRSCKVNMCFSILIIVGEVTYKYKRYPKLTLGNRDSKWSGAKRVPTQVRRTNFTTFHPSYRFVSRNPSNQYTKLKTHEPTYLLGTDEPIYLTWNPLNQHTYS